jgi:hypothetical protein
LESRAGLRWRSVEARKVERAAVKIRKPTTDTEHPHRGGRWRYYYCQDLCIDFTHTRTVRARMNDERFPTRKRQRRGRTPAESGLVGVAGWMGLTGVFVIL